MLNSFRNYRSKTVENAFLYSSSLILAQILMIVYTIILMRWVGSENYGIIAANFAAVLLLSFFINWGLNEWLVKTVPISDSPNALIGSVIQFKVAVGIIWWLMIILIFPAINSEIYQVGIIAIVLSDVWIDTTFNLLVAGLIGFEKVKSASYLLIFSRLIRVGSLALLVVLDQKSLILILAARLFCSLICMGIAWMIVNPKFVKGNIFGVIRVFKNSFSFNSFELLNLTFGQIDINLLTWFNGNTSLIGSYAFVTSILNMIMTIPMGINSIFLPQSIKSYRQDPRKFFHRFRFIFAGFFVLGLFCWLAIALPGTQWMMFLLGEDYSAGFYLLYLGSPILFLRTVNQSNHVYLITVGQEIKRLLPQIIAVLMKATLGIWIIIHWQAYGLILLGIGLEVILLIGFSLSTYSHYRKVMKTTIT